MTGVNEPRVVEGPPSTLPMMLRAALPVLPGVNLVPGVRKSGDTLPDLTLTRHDVPVDRAHVAAYSEVCGFTLKESLPVTYPHLLAFGLHMAIMTDRSFPFPAIGTVHLENTITQHRPITADERLQVTARPDNLRPHAKGRVFDLLTTIHSGGELVWEETSTFLRIGPGRPDERDQPGRSTLSSSPEPTGAAWKLPGDLGRRYAAVSGDHNPIHLYPLTAKAFGFPRQIAHGMWSKARCLAALDGRLPDAVTVEVAFKKPVLLPGTCSSGRPAATTGYAFALSRPQDGKPHLLGRFGPADHLTMASSRIMSRRDLEFLLYEWLDAEALTGRERYAEHDRGTFDAVLDLSEQIAADFFAPLNQTADAAEPYVGDDGAVVLPPEVPRALAAYTAVGAAEQRLRHRARRDAAAVRGAPGRRRATSRPRASARSPTRSSPRATPACWSRTAPRSRSGCSPSR